MDIASPIDGTIRWKVRRCGLFIDPRREICVIDPLESGKVSPVPVHGPCYGKVRTKLVDEGASVSMGTILFTFEECKHAVVMKDLCAECGANLRKEDGMPGERVRHSSANVAMVHNIPELHVSEQKAHELAREDELSLLKARKLVLLVDLDQTLIHTTITPPCEEYRKDVHCIRLNQQPSEPCMFTSIRPGALDFLQRISRIFELHICTFGNRMYAHTIARLLDPQSRYFASRILSRNEAFDPLTKTANMKALFPRGERMVCIIDDRDEVWRYCSNMVHVKPYVFFKSTGDINDPKLQLQREQQSKNANCEESAEASTEKAAEDPSSSSSSLVSPKVSQMQLAEQKEIDYLNRLYDILEEVHKQFYQELDSLQKSPEELVALRDRQIGRLHHSASLSNAIPPSSSIVLPNVTTIMNEMRWRVLADCRLVLSGLVVRTANLKFSRSYSIARTLGAEVQSEMKLPPASQSTEDSVTTHVVGCLHTQKVKEAQYVINKLKKAGTASPLHLVNPHWLWNCYYYWRRETEEDYTLPENSQFDPQSFEDWVIHLKNNSQTGTLRYIGPQSNCLPTWKVSPEESDKETPVNKTAAQPRLEAVSSSSSASSSSGDEDNLDSLPNNPLLYMAPIDRRNMIREVEEALASSTDNDDSSTSSSSDDSLVVDPFLRKSKSSSKKTKISGSPFKDPDDSSSSEEEELNSGLPKGWKNRKECKRRWSQAGSSEEDDHREWGACPEGYDYTDAEDAHRVLLLRDSSSSELDEKEEEEECDPSAKRRRYNDDNSDEDEDEENYDELDATL